MRILQMNFERGWRGGERQTLLCMRQFRKAGHDVSVLARKGGALARAAAADGFTVHEQRNVVGLCFFLVCKGRGFTVLHAQTANTFTWLALLKWVLRRPIAFTRRTAFKLPENAKKTIWKWRKADLFVAISEAAAAEPRRVGLRVVVIPSAVAPMPANAEHTRRIAAQFNPDNKRVLATAAALTREKDPCTVIRAIHQLKQTRDDFVFWHLGSGGETEQAAHQLVNELGLERHYIFAGFQERMEDWYRLMDVFVSGSRYEALGTAVLDAFLYRVPVVATNAGGVAESLAGGRGLLCDVGDDAAVASALSRILDDTALRESLVEKAHAYVLYRHNVLKMGASYLSEYRRLVDAARQ
jgi:glycosyltransferase involved in cell wall biosynthesis